MDLAEQQTIQAAIRAIAAGGPFACGTDGTVFRNRENLLPGKPLGYYREYTVNTPRLANRGKRRLVRGAAGELYYTTDHYCSFVRIDEASGDVTMVTGFSEASAPYSVSSFTTRGPLELTIDMAEATDKGGFMSLLAGALALPDYFGANWDALEECLADLQAAGTGPSHLILRNTAALSAADPTVLATFTDIVGGAASPIALTIDS